MAFYKRIKDLREDSDKTQKEIADYLGTCYQYYAVYEKGKSEISFERAIMLADYYNVSLDYIAERTDNKMGMCPALSKEQSELLNTYSRLSERDKRLISSLMNEWNNKNNGTLLLILRKTFRYFVLRLIVCYVLTVGGKTIFHLTVGATSTKSMPLSSR